MPAPNSSHRPRSPLPRLGVIALLQAAVMVAPCRAEDDEQLPLPRWDAESAGAAAGLGTQFNNLLPLPPDLRRLELGQRLEEAAPELLPSDSELNPNDLSLFLHGSTQQPDQRLTAAGKPVSNLTLREVPDAILKQAYLSGTQEYLIDPQGLVPEVARMDVSRLLEFHGSEARIRLYVMVMDGDQKLPDHALLDLVAQGALTKLDACLAIYPLGEPWRARFLVSKSVHEASPIQGLTELSEDCIQDAQRAADPAQQLQRFAIRLSTRLFWLEKDLPASVVERSSAPLREVFQGSSSTLEQGEADSGASWAGFFWRLIFAGVLGGGPTAFFILRRRRQQQRDLSHVWMLPDWEVPPRLGGNFSGGTSAVIDYGPRGRLPG